MSPPDSGSGDSSSEQHGPHKKLTVQEIIETIQELNGRLSKARDQTKSFPNARNGDGNQINNSHDNVGGNASTMAIDGNHVAEDDCLKVKGDLDKLCKELEFMKLAFQKLKKFEDDLTKPFKTLKQNVEDIEKGLLLAPNRNSSTKQVQSNLRVLRNNITKVKIQIPLQHHATQINSESRGYKETVASKEHDDLPNLNHEKEKQKLEQSDYCEKLFQRYENLNNRLKLCLLSFAIFPENAVVKKRLLRYWWVGEDIIPPNEEKEFTNETLKTFVEMEFIEPVNKKDGLNPRSYWMHPIVRSVVIIQARKEQFFVFDVNGNPTKDFSECYKACLVKVEEESSMSISKHFSKHEEDLGKLETLFNVSEQFPDFKEEWFSKMKRIRVLYLGRWESSTNRHIEVESPICFKGLGKMKNLRFLSLQGISGIKTLPNSLCQAAKLRILDLRACHNLEELPDNIGSLKKLTHLDISESYLLDQMPKELSSLSELRFFKGFVISDHKNSCSLEQLTALVKLEKLSINIIHKAYKAEHLGIAISKFEKLEQLKVAWGGATLTPEELSGSMESQGQGGQHKSLVEKPNAAAKPGIPSEKPDRSKILGEENVKEKQKSSSRKVKNQDKKEDEKKKKSGRPSLVGKKQGGKEENRNKESDAAQSTGSNQEKTQSSDNLSRPRTFGFLGSSKHKPRATASPNQEMTPNTSKDSKPRKVPPYEWNVAKLELQCYPETTPPIWLVPEVLPNLKRLHIKGGRLHNLPELGTEMKWTAETLRLKYLSDLKTDWKELREMFPDLEYLERVRCPKVMFCPCDGDGWCHLTPLLKDGVEN